MDYSSFNDPELWDYARTLIVRRRGVLDAPDSPKRMRLIRIITERFESALNEFNNRKTNKLSWKTTKTL